MSGELDILDPRRHELIALIEDGIYKISPPQDVSSILTFEHWQKAMRAEAKA